MLQQSKCLKCLNRNEWLSTIFEVDDFVYLHRLELIAMMNNFLGYREENYLSTKYMIGR